MIHDGALQRFDGGRKLPRREALQREIATGVEAMIDSFNGLTRHFEEFDALNKSLTRASGSERREVIERWQRETGKALRPNRATFDRG